MKKAVFLGASNTYGVGLHFFRDYYLDVNNLNTSYPYPHPSTEDIEFLTKNRFSSLLSNYLNLEEINKSEAGGSPAQSLYLLSQMDLSEIEYVIFEFSSINSFFDRFYINSDNIPKTPGEIESFLTNGRNDNIELRNKIYKWLDKFNPEEFTFETFKIIKDFINTNKNIKFIILIWRPYAIDFYSDTYDWVLNYSPKFPISFANNDPLIKLKNNIFVDNYLEESKLRVCDEFIHHHLMDFPIGHKDLHPSVNGHKKIFEILKSHIDEKNSTNSW